MENNIKTDLKETGIVMTVFMWFRVGAGGE
jgi:hypothetical protein